MFPGTYWTRNPSSEPEKRFEHSPITSIKLGVGQSLQDSRGDSMRVRGLTVSGQSADLRNCPNEMIKGRSGMPNDVRELPIEWSGQLACTAWGTSTPHHPKWESHADLDPQWHGYTNEIRLRILRQEGRSLELALINGGAEAKAVGVLSSDGNQMMLATQEITYHFTITGNTMIGEGFTRPHGSGRTGAFAVNMVELTAVS